MRFFSPNNAEIYSKQRNTSIEILPPVSFELTHKAKIALNAIRCEQLIHNILIVYPQETHEQK